MESKETLIVEGFIFRSLEDAELAQKEIGQIEFLEERMNYSNPEDIMLIYKKILQNRLFQTPIGLFFLQKVRESLVENYKGKEEIPNIILTTVYQRKIREQVNVVKPKVASSHDNGPIKKLRFSIICNIAFFLLIILMFFISLNGENPTILNYEEAILNKYSAWEVELTEREEKVRDLERKSED